mgnify:CR=1 FL=1
MASANVTNTYVVPEQSKVAPYYDDFDEAKNFQRILFRPGYPVQARELTQLQTILQNQVERFGQHIFTNGSPVIGGDVLLPPIMYSTINLSPEYAGTSVTASAFKDKTVTLSSNTSAVVFKVIHSTEATETDPPILYGTYNTGIVFAVPPGHNKQVKEPIWTIDFKSVAANKKQLCKGATE